MFVWLFWAFAAVLGLIGVAMLVAGWELVRRNPEAAGSVLPMRVHSIDLNLGDVTAAAAPAGAEHAASPPTDSDARRRALAQAIERMSEPGRSIALTPEREQSEARLVSEQARPPANKQPWEDTLPRVNLPQVVERTPPA